MSNVHICPNCGLCFSKRKSGQIYCSANCRMMAQRRHEALRRGLIPDAPEKQDSEDQGDLEFLNCRLEERIAKVRLALAANRQLAARALILERQIEKQSNWSECDEQRDC